MSSKSFDSILSHFEKKNAQLLLEAKHGLEKECLRVDANGVLSQKEHPKAFGSALTHPQFTLDFSEAQLEFVTKAHPSVESALKELELLHNFASKNLQEELLWPHSSPCLINDDNEINLATFGLTKKGYEKELYRKGLAFRYGKKMQLFSGIHYNFSFNKSFWEEFHKVRESKLKLHEFISESYLHICRNYLREGWLSTYLFGASPVVDSSYLSKLKKPLELFSSHTFLAKEATSIRTSHLGYFSKVQLQHFISHNCLKDYQKDLKLALDRAHPFYQKIGLYQDEQRIQINENFLQIEAEYYSRIRPKPYPSEKRVYEALKEGIGHLEVRNIDINPFLPLGIDANLLRFKHLFFIYCLFKKSPPLNENEAKVVCANQDTVALFGRKNGLKLWDENVSKTFDFKMRAKAILQDMKPIAQLLDQGGKKYQKALALSLKKIDQKRYIPSEQIHHLLKAKSENFTSWTLSKAKEYKSFFFNKELSKHIFGQLRKKTDDSLKQLKASEKEEEDIFYGYEDMEASTQMVLREAHRRGWGVKVLSRKDNIIEISAHGKKERLVQATQSSKDSLSSYFIMKNKNVTLKLLESSSLPVNDFYFFTSASQALKSYALFKDQKIVVKPNGGNYGFGVFFIEPNNFHEFKEAVLFIEKSQDEILVENYFKGDEFRFLVIDSKVVAVSKRVPAHVLGDGKKTIEELTAEKNKKIAHRSSFQKPLKLDPKSLKVLAKKGYTLSSIPTKNEQVFLRENSNVSTGGDSYDVSDIIHKSYKEIAQKAALCARAFHCGVDMLIKNPRKEAKATKQVILELNFNPALYLHRLTSNGVKRYVERDLLDALMG